MAASALTAQAPAIARSVREPAKGKLKESDKTFRV
jgi:hypothetical protein